ncbi:MAG: family 10 glycosylhydrolase [Ruminococcus sp.]|nr:family 10 glycosylhydrolase [Ruminococcus sp.]
MKRICIILGILMLTGCTAPQYGDIQGDMPESYIQGEEQLYLDKPDSTALNYSYQVGRWFPYMHFADYMQGCTEEEFRRNIRERFRSAAAEGVNTVYLHVHPCGDAYYQSDIFPPGTYLDGDYDPLAIMIEEAHDTGLSAHAWINPLRCQTTGQMMAMPESFILRQWAEDSSCGCIKTVGDRWYLDPSYPEARELICRCTAEIIEKYHPDGIHIDDYFYPTTDTEFDHAEFESSGSSDLSAWRTENCTAMVKELYDTVHSYDEGIIFGISPQGNINADYSKQYADVRLWSGIPGYCDYIVPQIYFGFLNETCPFEPTLRQWEALTESSTVQLVIGLAEYKQGQEDIWAGTAGENEWLDDPTVLEREIQLVRDSTANGYALYGNS